MVLDDSLVFGIAKTIVRVSVSQTKYRYDIGISATFKERRLLVIHAAEPVTT